jgi:hypothetical protein
MPGQVSDRAARYRQQAEHFQSLAAMEREPRARAQLLQIANDYGELAQTTTPRPSLSAISGRGRRNPKDANPVPATGGRSARRHEDRSS